MTPRFPSRLLASSVLLGASFAASPSSAQSWGGADLDIASPIDHHSANSHVYLAWVAKNTHRQTDPSRSEILVTVNDGTFFLDMAQSPDLCSPTHSGLPSGTFAETCGCYFDLTQVDTNRSKIDVSVQYANTTGSQDTVEAKAHRVLLPSSGPQRPPATAPLCPAPTLSPDLAPVAMAGPDLTLTGAGMLTLDGSASFDPEGTALTYRWEQVSGPLVALANPNAATTSVGLTNLTAPADLRFRLIVSDKSGGSGARTGEDVLVVKALPGSQVDSCSPWNRDALVASLSVDQPNGPGTDYSLRHFIGGQVGLDMQAEAQRLSTLYPDFKRLEIKSYVTPAGSGAQPTNPGGSVAGAAPGTRHWEIPVSPAPTMFWTGEPFSEGKWYRIDTKLNVYDTIGKFIDTSATYADSCLYETVFAKVESPGGSMVGRRIGGARLLLSDGTETLSMTRVGNGATLGRGNVSIGRDGVRVRVPEDVRDRGAPEEVVITPEDAREINRETRRSVPFRRKSKD